MFKSLLEKLGLIKKTVKYADKAPIDKSPVSKPVKKAVKPKKPAIKKTNPKKK